MSDDSDQKHTRISVWMQKAMVAGLEKLRRSVAEGGDEMSRSELIRLLVSEGARTVMGDRERTMREDVYDPAERAREDQEEKSRRGRRSRTKGHNYERACVREINERIPGIKAKRTLQHRGGGEGADIDCALFHIECKIGRKPNPRAALEQAEKDALNSGKIPVAVVKDDRRPAFVVMSWDDFLDVFGWVWDAVE